MATLRWQTKRIYEQPAKRDGLRVLVDRLWPRGVSKADAQIDVWAKELSPSAALRKWLHEDPDRYDAFARKYLAELQAQPDQVQTFLQQHGRRTITLLTAAKDLAHCHVPVLRAFLEKAATALPEVD